MLRGVLVECNYCGAPLDVREGVRLVKCRYCGSVSERQKQKTVAQQTPPDFHPPLRWTPPAHVPADSNQELVYKKKGGGGLALAIGILAVVVLPAAFIIPAALKESGVTGPDGEDLAKLDLNQTPAKMKDALGGNGSETSLYVKLSSDRYDYMTLSWDQKRLQHPETFYIKTKDPGKPDLALKAALEQKLGCPFDENGNWMWNQARLGYDLKNGSISGGTDVDRGGDKENPYWKRQFDAVWRIAVSAAFGQKLPVTDAEAKEVLGTGYAFASLKNVSGLTVENAQTEIQKLFPGARFEDDRMKAEVAIDHPMFRQAELEWKNEQGARLYHFGLRDRPGPMGYAGKHDAMAKCLTPALGNPEVNQTDYLKKKQDYSFQVGKTRVYVSSSWLYLYLDAPLEPAEWSRLITAIDACRK
jgi:hypothetical protein